MADPVVMNWAGGEHAFRLTIGELRALDDRCADGAYAAMFRVRSLRYRVDDVLETVRLGLIGGGMARDEASTLVNRIEEHHGIGEMAPLATRILFQAFHRREEVDLPGKPEAVEEGPPPPD